MSDFCWRDQGERMADDAYRNGESFEDARRILLCAWDGWTSGDPGREEVIGQLLATWRAMIALSGFEGELEPALDNLAFVIQQPPPRNDP